jgi:Tol biopolymer transport system component
MSPPVWAPDGMTFVYSRDTPNGPSILMATDGSSATRVLTSGRATAWTNDGQWLYFTRDTLRRIHADGAGEEIVQAPCLGTSTLPGISARPSPDGRLLALTNVDGVFLQICAPSWGPKVLEEGPESNVRWRPDGATVLFLRRRVDDGNDLMLMSSSGLGRRTLNRPGDPDVGPFEVSPDGRYLVTSTWFYWNQSPGIAVAELSSRKQVLLPAFNVLRGPAWRPPPRRSAR